ncbi:MAG: four helix bundle protein, partial [bacterium]|nr:four helix bundle protein [bacterium]
ELRIMNQELSNKIKTFTDLIAWKEGHKLVLYIYGITKKFPKDEMFGLTSQLKRCSVSITSNIAEGFSRQYYKEKLQFYSMALGSVTELQNQIFIARDVGYINDLDFNSCSDLAINVHKIINGLIKKTREIIHNS